MKISIQILVWILLLTSCDTLFDKKIEATNQMVTELEHFKVKPKFEEDSVNLVYPGLSKENLKPTVTALINKAADDFIEVAQSKDASENKYQDKIEKGLSRFTPLYLELDTEDRERVCHYYEELMDIVGLESSGGHLNNWMYDFDPTN